jgi:hypothetical protein
VVDAIHNTGTVGFERFAADVAAYNAAADSEMRQLRVPIIDLFTFTLTLGPEAYADHVHYTPAAQMLQAAFLAGSVLQLLDCADR